MEADVVPVESISAAPDRRRTKVLRALRPMAVIAYCTLVWLGCFHLYRLHNTFTFSFHPDEVGKISQIIQDFRNFNHPLLLLEATEKVLDWTGRQRDPQTVVQSGRDASAALAATCAVGFTLAGYFSGGFVGMIFGSLAVGLCPSLLVYAHYMKEDASLLSGIGITVAGMSWVWNRKTISAQLFGPMLAGLGAAMAVSGKYVGAVALTGALAAVLFAPRRYWEWIPIRLLLMLTVAIGAAAAINHRGVAEWDRFREGVEREYEHGTTEHSGVSLHRPGPFIFEVTKMETQPHVKVFAVALLLSVVTLRKGFGWGLILLLLSGVWLYALSMGAIPFHRYALPVVVLAHALAGLGAARVVAQFRRWRWLHLAAAVIVIALFAVLQGERCRDFTSQFADDSRDRLAAWAPAHLPALNRIAHDSYALLARSRLGPYRSQSLGFAPRYGPIDELRQRGYRYAVVCDSNYDRYFAPGAVGAPGEEDEFAYRKAWYQQLFDKGKLIWHAKADHPTYSFTNPEIRVYELPGN